MKSFELFDFFTFSQKSLFLWILWTSSFIVTSLHIEDSKKGTEILRVLKFVPFKYINPYYFFSDVSWIERKLVQDEYRIKEGAKITKLAELRKEFKISISFYPQNNHSRWANVLQVFNS